jgi:hypothetical protein
MHAPPRPRPISLSDEQLTSLMAAAQPLAPADRDPFLRAIAARFYGHSQIGDGELGRAIRDLQRDYFKAPSGIEVVRRAPKQLAKMGRPVGATSNR